MPVLKPVNIINIIDVLLIAFVLYKLIIVIRGTRAVQLLKGLIVILVATTVSDWLGLNTINWLLQKTLTMMFVALPVVFQPELRRALEQLGRGKFFARPTYHLGEAEVKKLIEETIRAVQVMAKNKMGALIIIERETGVQDYIETGVSIDGVVSAEMLINIFVPRTPLHDGAVIIRGDRIVAAACFLPLSEDIYLSKDLGTRHRAAIGITELSDALAVTVSEETGQISLAQEGRLYRYLDDKTLKVRLEEELLPKTAAKPFWHWRTS